MLLFFRIAGRFEEIYEKFKGLDFADDILINQKWHSNYEQSDIEARRIIKKFLKNIITNNDSIIDIGCGKGKMLYFFSKFPFKNINGLEYENNIAEIARYNLKKLNINNSRIFISDAKIFNDYDEYNYFYMFNPFGGDIFSSCARNIKQSVSRKPRKIRLIYHNPVYHDILISMGYSVEAKLPRVSYITEINVYTLPVD